MKIFPLTCISIAAFEHSIYDLYHPVEFQAISPQYEIYYAENSISEVRRFY